MTQASSLQLSCLPRLLEPSEIFIVNISTSVTRVMLNHATVTIVDNDGRGREGRKKQ